MWLATTCAKQGVLQVSDEKTPKPSEATGTAALMAGTIVGFVLARTVGIFGFHLTFSRGWPGRC